MAIPDGEKIEDVFIRFDTIHERDRHSIARQKQQAIPFNTTQRMTGNNACVTRYDTTVMCSAVKS